MKKEERNSKETKEGWGGKREGEREKEREKVQWPDQPAVQQTQNSDSSQVMVYKFQNTREYGKSRWSINNR